MKNVLFAVFALAASSVIGTPTEDDSLLGLAKRYAQVGACDTCTEMYPQGGFPGQGPTSCSQVKGRRGRGMVCDSNYGYVQTCVNGVERRRRRRYCSSNFVCTAAADGSFAYCNED
ncbi:hypothetical protein CLAFUW4_07686 [Fulvia fulva]|uniref:Uncharacterized protein n=1 Tax=Passalora fulva TaxID=5499 RepID=A0A9Q8LCY7_PASFU|nr:uncharacterized protein CLAFUR5_07815 [Fulvia fulva]KAK4628736.1 hypothetical protein CLAFUR4_07691 [Fulvia fulva]UJO15117.1 hypothetical protein CLAFUR5_07815 [Fulvia fulva]WPV12792.1 hypothetical protein CLAFUW4_07686 [Fulvia fulva]WPV27642.1 hypothetical protein CLAFUW7_07687 [Fulvia fulva]